MRKMLILAAVLAVACQPQERTFRPGPDGSINIGIVKEAGGPVTFRALIPNDSGEATTVSQYRTDCRCTSLRFVSREAGAGEDFVLEITYDPAYRKDAVREGFQLKFANNVLKDLAVVARVIPCNHPMEEDFRYRLDGGLWVTHSKIAFGEMSPGEGKSFVLGLGNGTGRSVSVALSPEGPHAGAVSLRNPGKLPRDGRGTVSVRFTMPGGIPQGDTLWIPVRPYLNGKALENTVTIYSIAK